MGVPEQTSGLFTQTTYGEPMKKHVFWRRCCCARCLQLISAAEIGRKVGIGLLGINKSDNLWGHGVSRIPNLTAPPTELSYGLLVPAVEIRYKSGPGSASELYLGTIEEPGSITAGIKRKYDGKNIDLYVFYSFIGSAWEDPYVLRRTKTDLSEYGAKLSYTQNRLTLSYRAALTDVDNDVVGARFSALERDGSLHTLKGSYGFPLKGLEADAWAHVRNRGLQRGR
jgi:hypothetical protein